MRKLFRLVLGRPNVHGASKLDETSPLTVFRTAKEKGTLKPEELTTIVKAIDSLREQKAGSSKFVLDEETFEALESLSAATDYDVIKMAAQVVSFSRKKC
jgi:hypothetical protein